MFRDLGPWRCDVSVGGAAWWRGCLPALASVVWFQDRFTNRVSIHLALLGRGDLVRGPERGDDAVHRYTDAAYADVPLVPPQRSGTGGRPRRRRPGGVRRAARTDRQAASTTSASARGRPGRWDQLHRHRRAVGVSNYNAKQSRTAHAELARCGIPPAPNQVSPRCSTGIRRPTGY